MTVSTNSGIGFGTVVLDTDDPPRLAEFYTALLGWQIESTEDDWITIGNGSAVKIAFQLALNHRPPTWPDNAIPQQFHLDLRVEDLAAASAYAESIGAQPVEGPDSHPTWARVPRSEWAPVLSVRLTGRAAGPAGRRFRGRRGGGPEIQ